MIPAPKPKVTAGLYASLLGLEVPKVVLPKVRIFPFERLKRVEAAFTSADLVPAPSMDRELVDGVVEAHERGAPPAEVARLVLDRYDEGGSAPLAALVERLCANPHFSGREETLRQTLEAHRMGLDAVTVFPLVPMIEGVLYPYLIGLAEEDKMSMRQMAKEMRSLPVFGVGIEGCACLICFLEASLYQHWKRGDDPEPIYEYARLNRNRLAHGGQKAGTRTDTLRCLLVLETVGALLRGLDELQDTEDGPDD